MDKLKKRFKEDPYFATAVVITSVIVLSRLMIATAKVVESSAYAYRASKI